MSALSLLAGLNRFLQKIPQIKLTILYIMFLEELTREGEVDRPDPDGVHSFGHCCGFRDGTQAIFHVGGCYIRQKWRHKVFSALDKAQIKSELHFRVSCRLFTAQIGDVSTPIKEVK